MNDLIGEDQTGVLIARDMLTLLLCGFVAAAVLAVPYINDPKKKAGNAAAAIAPPGNVVVDARWPDGWNTDVDLWIQAPGDVPVGYSNKSGLIMNLLRDDLGNNSPTPLRYENGFSRGIPPGEYVVNLHLFRNIQARFPVPVEVTARCVVDGGDVVELVHTTVALRREGEETTAVRFRLDETCGMDAGSVNALFKPLRSARVKR